MPTTILMGDPQHFSVLGGANPHTRDAFGRRKRVNAELAKTQWHAMARALIAHGVEVCVIEAHAGLSGLVYPANAGFLYPLSGAAGEQKSFYLSHLLPTRFAEREVYRPFIRSLGYRAQEIAARFEGEADFFPAGEFMIFTHGELTQQRFVPRLGWPPYKRVYGFRSDAEARTELMEIARDREVLSIELRLEAHYHGDTVLCSFGSRREFILAYMAGIADESRKSLRDRFGARLIELSDQDAGIYAANAFQTDFEGKLYLFLPEGVSGALMKRVIDCGVEPVTVDVSEFLAKGGGSIKCMILDLGPTREQPAAGAAFRAARSYQALYYS